MQLVPTPEIYKITIGNDPKNGFSFFVGQIIKGGSDSVVISRIFMDASHFYFFGVIRYCIFIKNDKNEEIPFRFFENMPVSVSFNSDSKYMYV